MYISPELLGPNQEKCAGKNCTNEGKHQLTIVYLNKTGLFCDSCKEDLLNDNL